MVLENILKPSTAEKHPVEIFFIAVVFTLVAMFISKTLFPSEISLLTICFITLFFTPLFTKLFLIEEKKDIALKKENIFHRHRQMIKILTFFFIGIMLTTATVYFFIPESSGFFELQDEKLQEISGSPTGAFNLDQTFYKILLNNTSVMLMIFLTSILFCSTAIFILTWNASIIGVFIGKSLYSLIHAGMSKSSAYVIGIPMAISQLLIHGIPEILAYFMVGIAGGILSSALMKSNREKLELVFKDSLMFLIAAEFLIVVAAFLEVIF